ncbi:MAG: hypothetical protein R3C10_02460 [Pirellulales bacterium]
MGQQILFGQLEVITHRVAGRRWRSAAVNVANTVAAASSMVPASSQSAGGAIGAGGCMSDSLAAASLRRLWSAFHPSPSATPASAIVGTPITAGYNPPARPSAAMAVPTAT